ncbi:MAG: hypothetical protein CSA97_02535 [Bacteroidetes bacterium]|nr:MAG: hypothetical protein CSA97_02535 [Bacteroidota bacterium]
MRLVRGLRLLLYLLCILALLGILAVGGLFLLEKQWGEIVVERVLDQVNQELRIPVKTSGVDFTFFADFPQASIRLRDVCIPTLREGGEAEVPPGEELLRAKSLLLVLNPFDLLRGEYRVEALRLSEGSLRLEKYAEGGDNYTLQQAGRSDSTSGGLNSWAIEGFELENMVASYLDGRSGLRVRMQLATLEANARYEGEALGLRLKGEGGLEELVHEGKTYAKGEELRLDTELRYDSLALESPRSVLEVEGNRLVGVWSLSNTDGALHARIDAPGVDLQNVLKLAERQGYNLPEGLKVDGQLTAGVDLHGAVRNGLRLHATVTVRGEGELGVEYKGNEYRITRLSGTFSNGEQASARSSRFELQACHITRGQSHADLELRLTNLKRPAVYGRIDLRALDNEFPLGSLAKYVPYYGEIVARGEGVASLRGVDHIREELLRHMKTKMTVSFSGLTVTPGGGQRLDSLTGVATFKDRDLLKGSIRARWGEANIDVGVNAKRFWSLATGKGKSDWTVNTAISGWSIPDYIVPDWGGDENGQEDAPSKPASGKAKGTKQRTFWDYVGSMQGKLSLNGCRYRGGKVDSLQASFSGNGEQVLMDIKQGRLFDGRIRGKLGFQSLTADRQLLRADLHPESIDIQRIFRQFANFGQSNVKSENINGRLSGEVTIYAPLQEGELLLPEFRLQAKVNVYKGGLKNLAGMEKLSRFIEMKELQDIRFSTLSNTISVENSEIRIPEMDIRSSALSLKLSGRQHFDSRYAYRLQLKLGDVLFNRWKRRRTDAQEEVLEDKKSGGGSLFLRIEGDSTQVNVRYDREALKEQIARRFAREKEELKTLFKEEFGTEEEAPQATDVRKSTKVIWEEEGTNGGESGTKQRGEGDSDNQEVKPEDRRRRKSETERKKPSVIWED